MIKYMNHLIAICALLLLFVSSCTYRGPRESSYRAIDQANMDSWSPDIVMETFTFSEVTTEGIDVEFSANRANYFQNVDIVAFDSVTGNFSSGAISYRFSLPTALYDRSKKFLVTTDRVLIEGDRGFTITGDGGVLDFGSRNVTLERNVKYLSRSLRIEGERGFMSMKKGTLEVERVEAFIESVDDIDSDLGGALK